MKTALLALTTALVFAAPLLSPAETPPRMPPDLSEAPRAIQELAAEIQGKSPEEIRAVIVKRLGEAQRDVGSGRRIEQWDTSGGVLTSGSGGDVSFRIRLWDAAGEVLTFPPGAGPVFRIPYTETVYRLIRTRSPVRDSLLRGYEMMTPLTGGTRYWLGNIEIADDRTYLHTDSGQHADRRADQAENFFMRHPAGKVEARYLAPVTGDTPLETLPEGTAVARLTFTPADGAPAETFTITSSWESRSLDFAADIPGKPPLRFLMDTGWKSFRK